MTAPDLIPVPIFARAAFRAQGAQGPGFGPMVPVSSEFWPHTGGPETTPNTFVAASLPALRWLPSVVRGIPANERIRPCGLTGIDILRIHEVGWSNARARRTGSR